MKCRFAAIGLLLLMAWLELSSLAATSPTVDEPLRIMRGTAYVRRGEERYLMDGPVLSDALSGLMLELEPNLQLYPINDPVWSKYAELFDPDRFIWANTVPAQRIIFLSRLPIIAVSFVLGAFIFRWAAQRTSALPALGALTLYVFCPNLLAHARLATTDVVTAALFLISAYAFDRALASPTLKRRLASGGALGLALAAKFSAVIIPVSFAILVALRVWKDRRHGRALMVPIATLLITGLIGGLTLWAVYRFRIGPIDPGGPSVPAPYYWTEWRAASDYLADPFPVYLFGQMTPQGRWYDYPIALLVKTPLPVLIMAFLALIHTARARSWQNDLPLYLTPGLYFSALVFLPHDLGYRYLLPVLPFIYVASAAVIAAALRTRWTKIVIGLLIAWQIIGTLRYYPYYLTYFNEIVGGPDRGRYILIDSSLDWGQDLIGLKQYVDQHQIDHLNLSYFGTAHPEAIGLQANRLPPYLVETVEQAKQRPHVYSPSNPAPGIYAISATSLMDPRNSYEFFRDRTPTAIIGGSIYVYTVLPQGQPTNLALAGLQVEEIDPATYAKLATNDVQLRWFNAKNSFIASPTSTWVAIVDRQPIPPELAFLFSRAAPEVRARTVTKDRPYSLYHFDLGAQIQAAADRADHTAHWSPDIYPQLDAASAVTLPIKFGTAAELLGYQLITHTAASEISVLTYWQAGSSITKPLELFVHALDSNAVVAATADGFGAPLTSWKPGDLIVQVSRLKVAPETGPVWVEIGIYDPGSGERLPIIVDGREVDQRLLLRQIFAPPGGN